MLNHASFIWQAADILRGTYKQHQYGDVILPFTVLARLDAVLAPTKAAVLAATEGLDADTEPSMAMLRAKAQHPYSFFNRSRHDLKTLQGDPDNLERNLRDYVQAFSSNVRGMFDKYKFDDTILDLASHDLLLQVMQHFSKADLHPDAVSNEQMGNIFEELIRQFAEASNETAGEHFTPREVIELMVSLLVDRDESLMTPGIVREVYDPTAGTGGMLTAAADRIHAHNANAQVNLLGQEINPASFAICMADMLIQGQPIENIVLGNTLTDPAFEERTFHYGLSNPPFGQDWKQYRKQIETEHAVAGFAGRFGPGLPRVSDGSLLFLMHLLSKLREPKPGDQKAVAGRGAIVLNGSPLFTGGAGSGESNIRKWILDSDYLEAIVGLPTDMFYNTGIATYIWVLNKEKPAQRRGRVQLIDATGMYEKMRKSIGSKRRMLSEQHITEITRLFAAFEESKHSKVFRTTDFFYRTITVERPLRLNYALTDARIKKALDSRALSKWDTGLKASIASLASSDQRAVAPTANTPDIARADTPVVERAERAETSRATFTAFLTQVLNGAGIAPTAAQLKTLVAELGEPDDEGELVTSAGKVIADASRRDTENVPWDEDIHEYLEREVKPFVPDAWIDESKTKEGAEIPFTRHFYEYVPPRPLAEIDRDLDEVLGRIRARLEAVRV